VYKSAQAWRQSFEKQVPNQVQKLWDLVLASKATRLADLSNDRKLCATLIELLAIADETSRGAGTPLDPADGDAFDAKAEYLLVTSNSEAATLGLEVRESVARILPKMHVPVSGFTIRSFSHYLALVPSSEIKSTWHPIGTAPIGDDTLDILILPWPLNLDASNFKLVKSKSATMKNLPREFGFFRFDHKNPSNVVEMVVDTVQKISALSPDVGIDAVIMPELSLNEAEYNKLSSMLLRMGIYLIAGVAGSQNSDGTTSNTVRFNIPLGVRDGVPIPATQSKHHRWKLERRQIERYGLSLPKSKSLWEHIPIGDRKLNFICLREWLALCLLICEDLARPDPVGDVIRAVGPNLVIALLLDGPQLEDRWSAQYATALADDPGSSVLTLTCTGMTRLRGPSAAKPKGKGKNPQTVGKVALWKDIRGRTHVIDVKSGDAAVLHIEVQNRTGWTVDGRDDGGASGYPLLTSVSIFKKGKRLGRTSYVS
jgi:hypothetical protein